MSSDFEGSLPNSDCSSDNSSMKEACTSDKDSLISPHDSLVSPCASYDDASLKEEEVPDVEEELNSITKGLSRRVFNLLAFGTNTFEKRTEVGIPNKKKTKKILTQDEINKIIYILQHWDTGIPSQNH